MKIFSLLSCHIVFGFLLLVLVSLSSHAQTIGPNRVLIRNVVLFDPNGVVEDKVVNILLRDTNWTS